MQADFAIVVSKNVNPSEFVDLMASVGWGEPSEYRMDAIQDSLAAYPFVAHARDSAGRLIGYLSAFSDHAFSTFIGELVVRPDAQRKGVGKELMATLEREYPGVPIYAYPFADSEPFFLQSGFRAGERQQRVVFKIP